MWPVVSSCGLTCVVDPLNDAMGAGDAVGQLDMVVKDGLFPGRFRNRVARTGEALHHQWVPVKAFLSQFPNTNGIHRHNPISIKSFFGRTLVFSVRHREGPTVADKIRP